MSTYHPEYSEAVFADVDEIGDGLEEFNRWRRMLAEGRVSQDVALPEIEAALRRAEAAGLRIVAALAKPPPG